MNAKTFTTNRNNKVQISINDEGTNITIVDSDGDSLGEIILLCCEDGYPPLDVYYITNLGLDKCKGQGIGRAALQFHNELFGAPITAAEDDGMTRDDGSNLTGDGPGFVHKMRVEGIIT